MVRPIRSRRYTPHRSKTERMAQIRDAIRAGAGTYAEIAAVIGTTAALVRQYVGEMPDLIYRRQHLDPRRRWSVVLTLREDA